MGGLLGESSSDEDPLFHSWRSDGLVLIEDSLFLRDCTAGTAACRTDCVEADRLCVARIPGVGG
jgi:hypothetical protein